MNTIDRQNMPWLADRMLQPVTRYFLTDQGLITRLDKSRPVEAKGNGFVISEKGLSVLTAPTPEQTKPASTIEATRADKPNPPHGKTTTFERFGQTFLLMQHRKRNERSNFSHLEKKSLLTKDIGRLPTLRCWIHSIYRKRDCSSHLLAVSQTTNEIEFSRLVTYRVYRHLVGELDHVPINGPDHPPINKLELNLPAEEAPLVLSAYSSRDLSRFGQWTTLTAPCTQRKRTDSAYERAAALLQREGGVRRGPNLSLVKRISHTSL